MVGNEVVHLVSSLGSWTWREDVRIMVWVVDLQLERAWQEAIPFGIETDFKLSLP